MSEETSRTEQLNQLTRAVCVLLLLAGFVYGFIVSKVVSTETYALTLGIAMTWWFKSRDEKQAADAKAAATPKEPAP